MATGSILSQDEVDALLRGASGGAIDNTPTAPVAGRVEKADFSSMDRKVVRGNMPGLENVNKQFSEIQSLRVSQLLGVTVEINPKGITSRRYSKFLETVPNPSALISFGLGESLKGQALLAMPSDLVYLLVDFAHGGTYQSLFKPEGREFSTFQQGVIREVAEELLGTTGLARAWKSLYPITPQLKADQMKIESNPQFVQIVDSLSAVIETAFTMKIQSEQCEETKAFSIVYPYAMLEPIKERLYSGHASQSTDDDTDWRGRLQDHLPDCPVTLEVTVGTASLSINAVSALAVGDFIPLETRRIREPSTGGLSSLVATVTVGDECVGDGTFFEASAGGHQTVKLVTRPADHQTRPRGVA